MRYIGFLVLLLLVPTVLDGQQKKDTTTSVLVSEGGSSVNVNFPSTIELKGIHNQIEKPSILEKNMPWIVALLIGIISAFVNFWMAHRLRQSNERNLQRQIDSNEKNLKEQIDSNERFLQKQIETTKETKILEFKATIASKNRQEWLSELRHTLTEYLSSLSMISIVSKGADATHAKRVLEANSNYIGKMSLAKAKLELLMNEEKDEQKKLLDEIENMLSIVSTKKEDTYIQDIRKARSETINAARKVFEIHWEKIKKLQ